MSILTIKIKHNRDFTEELEKAYLIANFAIQNRNKLSTKYIKHIGLHSVISCQVLNKYGLNKKCKKINKKRLKLTIPNQKIRVKGNEIYLIPLKMTLINESKYNMIKINQVELNNEYAYVNFEVADEKEIVTENYIGVDLNMTGHCVVAGNPNTGKILKLGRKSQFIKMKYKALRRAFQKKKLFKKLKQTKNKESNKIKDLNHKMTTAVVKFAKANNCGIKLEDLKNIRVAENKKIKHKTFRYSLNNWPSYQTQQMILYKAKLQGIPVTFVDPRFTSQKCSKCNELGNRNRKNFKCEKCHHIDHADVNASFNIAKCPPLDDLCKTGITKNGSIASPLKQYRKKSRKTDTKTSESNR